MADVKTISERLQERMLRAPLLKVFQFGWETMFWQAMEQVLLWLFLAEMKEIMLSLISKDKAGCQQSKYFF
jgi:hypothetical protein